MTAGYETLKRLQAPGVYEGLEARAAALEAGIRANLDALGLGLQLNRVGSMMTLFFTEAPVTGYEAATGSDQEQFARYFRAMLERGIYLAPSQFEAAFVSLAHSDADIEETAAAQREALRDSMR
jgi:glutamate-1-semialdehyde 2,1-aminomutase